MPDSLPNQEVKAEDRLVAARQMLDRASNEQLSTLEQYVLQKAVGLFLLGKRNDWGALHTWAAIDGQADLPKKPYLADDDSDDVRAALMSLEQKGLLHFGPEDPSSEDSDIICYVAAIRNQQIVLLKNERQR